MATIDNMRVLFGQGTSASFDAEIKEPNKLYFLTDTHEIYLGGQRYAIGDDVTVEISGSGDTVSNVSWNENSKVLTFLLSNAGSADSVVSAIQSAIAPCVKHIYTQRGSSILVDDSDKSNVEISLNIAQSPYAGNVLIEECSDGLRANVTLPDVPVQNVKSGDKILNLEGTSLTSTLSITTEIGEDDKHYVILKGINGVEISKFDASDFVTSGMLQSVSIEEMVVSGQIHKFLVLTFLVEGGQTSTVKVDLQELVDVYSAKPNGGLTLNNGQFSITNEVTANYGVNTDKTFAFGSTVTLNTIMYDAHGSITGTKAITFSMPGLSGSVGTQGTNSRLLTFVSISNSGTLSGEYVDVSTSVNNNSTHGQIPTAKSVYDAIQDSIAVWDRI